MGVERFVSLKINFPNSSLGVSAAWLVDANASKLSPVNRDDICFLFILRPLEIKNLVKSHMPSVAYLAGGRALESGQSNNHTAKSKALVYSQVFE